MFSGDLNHWSRVGASRRGKEGTGNKPLSSSMKEGDILQDPLGWGISQRNGEWGCVRVFFFHLFLSVFIEHLLHFRMRVFWYYARPFMGNNVFNLDRNLMLYILSFFLILFSSKKEGNLTFWDSMYGPGEYYAKWNKPVSVVYTLIIPILQRRNWNLTRFNVQPKVTQLLSGKKGIWNLSNWHWSPQSQILSFSSLHWCPEVFIKDTCHCSKVVGALLRY